MSPAFTTTAYQDSLRRQRRRELLLSVGRWVSVAAATILLVLLSLSSFEDAAVHLVAGISI
jgi:hypothetical protein